MSEKPTSKSSIEVSGFYSSEREDVLNNITAALLQIYNLLGLSDAQIEQLNRNLPFREIFTGFLGFSAAAVFSIKGIDIEQPYGSIGFGQSSLATSESPEALTARFEELFHLIHYQANPFLVNSQTELFKLRKKVQEMRERGVTTSFALVQLDGITRSQKKYIEAIKKINPNARLGIKDEEGKIDSSNTALAIFTSLREKKSDTKFYTNLFSNLNLLLLARTEKGRNFINQIKDTDQTSMDVDTLVRQLREDYEDRISRNKLTEEYDSILWSERDQISKAIIALGQREPQQALNILKTAGIDAEDSIKFYDAVLDRELKNASINHIVDLIKERLDEHPNPAISIFEVMVLCGAIPPGHNISFYPQKDDETPETILEKAIEKLKAFLNQNQISSEDGVRSAFKAWVLYQGQKSIGESQLDASVLVFTPDPDPNLDMTEDVRERYYASSEYKALLDLVREYNPKEFNPFIVSGTDPTQFRYTPGKVYDNNSVFSKLGTSRNQGTFEGTELSIFIHDIANRFEYQETYAGISPLSLESDARSSFERWLMMQWYRDGSLLPLEEAKQRFYAESLSLTKHSQNIRLLSDLISSLVEPIAKVVTSILTNRVLNATKDLPADWFSPYPELITTSSKAMQSFLEQIKSMILNIEPTQDNKILFEFLRATSIYDQMQILSKHGYKE